MPATPTIKLTRSTLRPWRIDDAADLATNANNSKIASKMTDAFPHPYTTEKAKNWIETIAAVSSSLLWAVEIDGKARGGVGIIFNTDVERLCADIGYWLSEDYWNKGIISEALKAIVKHTFDTTDIVRIQAKVFSSNPASAKVLEKSGFTYEGTLKKSIIKNNELLDLLVYATFK